MENEYFLVIGVYRQRISNASELKFAVDIIDGMKSQKIAICTYIESGTFPNNKEFYPAYRLKNSEQSRQDIESLMSKLT